MGTDGTLARCGAQAKQSVYRWLLRHIDRKDAAPTGAIVNVQLAPIDHAALTQMERPRPRPERSRPCWENGRNKFSCLPGANLRIHPRSR